MQADEQRLLSARPSLWSVRDGLPLAVLALLAVFASFFGRLLAPALFGAGTGIEVWIMLAQLFANFLTQIVAVGGIAFALRSLLVTLGRASLGVGYRMVVIPATLGTVILTLSASGLALDAERASGLAICAVVTALSGAPVVLLLPASRAVGLVLALTAIAGALDFAGMRLSGVAIERGSVAGYRGAAALVTVGYLLEVGLVLLAFGWLAARKQRRAIVLGAASAVLALLLIFGLYSTSTAGASTFEIVVARSLGSLLRAPAPFVPPAARLVLEAATWVGTVAALLAARRAPLAPVVALCLLSRGALDIPIPALLLVVASLALPAYGAVPLGLLATKPSA